MLFPHDIPQYIKWVYILSDIFSDKATTTSFANLWNFIHSVVEESVDPKSSDVRYDENRDSKQSELEFLCIMDNSCGILYQFRFEDIEFIDADWPIGHCLFL